MEGPMILRILTPAGVAAETDCDSAVLLLRDGTDGKGGGLIGVQKGHAPAVLALGAGPVRASLGGKTVYRAVLPGGFASVREDVITVITDSADSD